MYPCASVVEGFEGFFFTCGYPAIVILTSFIHTSIRTTYHIETLAREVAN